MKSIRILAASALAFASAAAFAGGPADAATPTGAGLAGIQPTASAVAVAPRADAPHPEFRRGPGGPAAEKRHDEMEKFVAAHPELNSMKAQLKVDHEKLRADVRAFHEKLEATLRKEGKELPRRPHGPHGPGSFGEGGPGPHGDGPKGPPLAPH